MARHKRTRKENKEKKLGTKKHSRRDKKIVSVCVGAFMIEKVHTKIEES